MKKILTIACLMAFPVFAAFSQHTIQSVSVDEATVLLQSHPDMTVIDVRKQSEVLAGTIEGAQHYSMENGAFLKQLETLDKHSAYLIYGNKGEDKRAVSLMKDAGFDEVYWLEGGYDAWLTR